MLMECSGRSSCTVMVMQRSLPVNLFLSSSVIRIVQTCHLLTYSVMLLKQMSGRWEREVGRLEGGGRLKERGDSQLC